MWQKSVFSHPAAHVQPIMARAGYSDSCILLIISPPTALMKDQVCKYGRRLPCTYVGEARDDEGIFQGKYKVVYVSPDKSCEILSGGTCFVHRHMKKMSLLLLLMKHIVFTHGKEAITCLL